MNINATLLGQTIAFVIFVWFCFTYVWPPLLAAIEERQNKIKEGLSSADKAKDELSLVKEQVKQELAKAKEQALTIVEQANNRKKQLLDDARQIAETEKQAILNKAYQEIQNKESQLKAELQTQVSELAIASAEKILQQEVDRKNAKTLVDEMIAKL